MQQHAAVSILSVRLILFGSGSGRAKTNLNCCLSMNVCSIVFWSTGKIQFAGKYPYATQFSFPLRNGKCAASAVRHCAHTSSSTSKPVAGSISIYLVFCRLNFSSAKRGNAECIRDEDDYGRRTSISFKVITTFFTTFFPVRYRSPVVRALVTSVPNRRK